MIYTVNDHDHDKLVCCILQIERRNKNFWEGSGRHFELVHHNGNVVTANGQPQNDGTINEPIPDQPHAEATGCDGSSQTEITLDPNEVRLERVPPCGRSTSSAR